VTSEIGRYCELHGLSEETDLRAGMDFRLPQYRREVFLRFYEFHAKWRSHPGAVYYMFPHMARELDMSQEDRLWFAFINGCSQHVLTTYLIYRQFPVLEQIDLTELDSWFRQEYARLGWDTDRRYHKKMFVECVANYRKNLAGRSQQEFFQDLVLRYDHYTPFLEVWNGVRDNFLSFGRLSTFSYLEYLRIMGMPIDCNTLFLDDMDGSKSHRNGLAIVLGRDDLDWHTSNPDFSCYSKEQIAWLADEAAMLLEQAQARLRGRSFEDDVNYFTLESTLCCYKSWHRPNRRYPNVYNDMFYRRIRDTEKGWPEEDFSVFWEARRRNLPVNLRLEDNPQDPGLHPRKQNFYLTNGKVIMMSQQWECFDNEFDREIWGEKSSRSSIDETSMGRSGFSGG
jgi:Alpha-glutamyl/putrescinyl thymine pyrophosphorylase clade 2